MDFESLANSRLGIGMALSASRAMPRAAGYALAQRVARRVAKDRMLPMTRAIRANQWVVSGRALSAAELDQAAFQVLANSGRFLFDLFHLPEGPDAIFRLVKRDEVFERLLAMSAEGPLVVAGIHLGNFDLVGRALAYSGWRPQVLSVPDPTGAYEQQNEMRRQAGFDITPVSVAALTKAARRLKDGGVVVTGLDRPIPDPEAQVRFFGEPAPLPLLHVRLAMRAGAPVVVASAPLDDDGRYRLEISEPIAMEGGDAVANAERVAAEAERMIAARPRQWAMPHAVWPHVEAP